MRWITKSHLHLDRVATPWLISRWVDPDAQFSFRSWDDTAPYGDAIAFGVPDVDLSSHDERGTCFHKVLMRYALTDPALALMDRIVAAGVSDALGASPPDSASERELVLGAALNVLGTGMGLALDDEEHLRTGMRVYDGIFALCQTWVLPTEIVDYAPATLPDRVRYLRAAIGR